MSASGRPDSQPPPATAPDQPARPAAPSVDLPYGPLPARPEPPLDAEVSSELELASGHSDADDDVHFGVAAKALGVSRKTVERMVKRGQLERGPSGAQATVSKRALVAELEQRRRDIAQLARAAEVEPGPAGGTEDARSLWPQDATTELQELLRPVLEPLLDEFVAARTRAAVLERQLADIDARAARERVRDELLVALATGGWRERRRARRAALRHYVLGEHPSQDSV